MNNIGDAVLFQYSRTPIDDIRLMALELIARRKDEEDAARLLDIDPPEPGSPLARAFAANAALLKERDAAYQKGRSDARKEALIEIDRIRAHLIGEPCNCARMEGLYGPHFRGDTGCRYEARQ